MISMRRNTKPQLSTATVVDSSNSNSVRNGKDDTSTKGGSISTLYNQNRLNRG